MPEMKARCECLCGCRDTVSFLDYSAIRGKILCQPCRSEEKHSTFEKAIIAVAKRNRRN